MSKNRSIEIHENGKNGELIVKFINQSPEVKINSIKVKKPMSYIDIIIILPLPISIMTSFHGIYDNNDALILFSFVIIIFYIFIYLISIVNQKSR